MYNQYIYEKKINEEKLKQIENEKQKHFQKIYLINHNAKLISKLLIILK